MAKANYLAVMLGVFLSLNFLGTEANAGLFGPGNYEECVLENMKGQQQFMLETVRQACRKRFPEKRSEPEEPSETTLPAEYIKHTWCKSGRESQSVCLGEVSESYKITRVIGRFFKTTCEENDSYRDGIKSLEGGAWLSVWGQYKDKNSVRIVGTKAWFSSTYHFKTPPADYKCLNIEFIGFYKP
ncbi:MAG: hypothetical protein AB7U75_17220 [Hyphomicrobiaceae bacterium]